MATTRPKFKTSFKATRTYEPIHTGGKVVLSGDGSWLVSTLNEQAVVTEVETGVKVHELKGDSSAVTTLTITPSPASPQAGGYLLTCGRSLALQIYALPSLDLHRSIPKAHEAPIITCAADPTGTLFATGSADGIVKVWDAAKGHCTHVFKGHGGVISALVFDIAKGGARARLVSGADDCKIRVWDLRTRECVHVLDGHVSVVRGLEVTPDGKTLVSGGRDKVLNLWDLERGVLRRTTPVFETLEAVGLVEVAVEVGKGKAKEGETRLAVFTGGDKGVVRLWDLVTGEAMASKMPEATGKTHEIVDVLYTAATSSLTAVYVDQNIVIRSVPSLAVTRQIIGFNDEVIDVAFLAPPAPTSASSDASTSTATGPESHLAVATNSDLIRVYDTSRFNTALLEGHNDVVLCLNKTAQGDVLVSGSKDRTARVWRAFPPANEGDAAEWVCVGSAAGHVESVGAIAVSKRERHFFVTASQDRTAKVWDLAALLAPETHDAEAPLAAAQSLVTLKIHDKDINALDISPNDKLLVSGSQDRTAKLFAVQYQAKTKSSAASASLQLLGTFKGHKRGVWSVKFSNADQCVATASGDRTIKLWNLHDFSCIKTFEGHSNSVLRVDFLTKGMQMASCASDGLVKVWNVKDEQCAATLDNHDEKIWALAVSRDESQVVSGGADSVITFWQDVTEEEETERVAAREELVLKEQDFETYLSIQDYSNAILLALSMDQPKRLLKLFTEVRTSSHEEGSITGSVNVDAVIKGLQGADLRQMMGYVKDWNTVGRTSDVAQAVLHAILKLHSAEAVLEALEPPRKPVEEDEDEPDFGMDEDETEEERRRKAREKKKLARKEAKAGEVLGALIPYTERHFARADKLVRESFIVEHLLGMMESLEEVEGALGEMEVDGSEGESEGEDGEGEEAEMSAEEEGAEW